MTPEPRALRPAEYQLVAALLLHGGLPTMSPEDLRVVGTCECGTCPSIYLADPAGPAAGDHRATRIIEASTEAALVLLHLQADVPTFLEIAPTTSAPARLPAPAELEFSPR